MTSWIILVGLINGASPVGTTQPPATGNEMLGYSIESFYVVDYGLPAHRRPLTRVEYAQLRRTFTVINRSKVKAVVDRRTMRHQRNRLAKALA